MDGGCGPSSAALIVPATNRCLPPCCSGRGVALIACARWCKEVLRMIEWLCTRVRGLEPKCVRTYDVRYVIDVMQYISLCLVVCYTAGVPYGVVAAILVLV